MKQLEAIITRYITKIFGKPDVVKYLSGKTRQPTENNNENNKTITK
jgi:hypothetical protein